MHLQLLDIYINAYKIFWGCVLAFAFTHAQHYWDNFHRNWVHKLNEVGTKLESTLCSLLSWGFLAVSLQGHIVQSHMSAWIFIIIDLLTVIRASADRRGERKYRSVSVCISQYFQKEGRGGVKNHFLLTLLSSKALNNVSS